MSAPDETRLVSGRLSARVATFGAALVDLRRDNEALVSGPPHVDASRGHHGAVLAPWPNRIARGRYRFDGAPLEVPEKDAAGHALHGFAYRRSWEVQRRGRDHVALELLLGPESGYPFVVALAVSYRLTPRGLDCTAEWTAVGACDAPFGIGFHPYLRPGPSRLEEWILQVPARSAMDTDPRTRLPLAERPVTPLADFTAPRAIGPTRFSRAYRRMDTEAPVVLADPRGHALEVRASPLLAWTQVFTGDLADALLRRRGLAVEPQTCPPDAFATGVDLRRLTPGLTESAYWSIRVSS